MRKFSSLDQAPPPPANLDVPLYWLRPFQPLPATPGMHRFVWDIHTAPPAAGGATECTIAAVPHDTPCAEGKWLPAGNYTVKLTAAGQTYSQPLIVKPLPK